MPNFAVIDGENVINTIVAESLKIAQEVTQQKCVEFTIEPAETGGTYVNNVFIKRKPFPSWILNSKNEWEAPIPYPSSNKDNEKSYSWDEEKKTWIEI
jgi:hypothetical protein